MTDFIVKMTKRSINDPFVHDSDYSTLADALEAAIDKVLLITDEWVLDADTSFPATVSVWMFPGSKITTASETDGVVSSYTLTINSPFQAGMHHIFDTSIGGSVLFGNNSVDAICPEWFGALGDGSTNNVLAFSAVVACANASAATSLNGVTIQFGDGTYYFATANDAFREHGIYLKGVTKGTTVIKGADGNIFSWQGPPTVGNSLYGTAILECGGASNLSLIYIGSPGASASCFYLSRAKNFWFTDLKVDNIARLLYTDTDSADVCNDIHINNITGRVNDSNVATIEPGYGAGLYIDNVTFSVKGATVPGSVGHVAAKAGTILLKVGAASWDTIVLSNILTTYFYDGIKFYLASGKNVLNVWMNNVILDYCDNDGFSVNNVVAVTGACKSLFISNSWFVGYSNIGINFTGGYVLHAIIRGCKIYRCNSSGIYLDSSNQHILIDNNDIYGIGRDGVSNGIEVEAATSNFAITNNNIGYSSAAEGITDQPVNGINIGLNCGKYLISGNQSVGTVAGYEFNDPTANLSSILATTMHGDNTVNSMYSDVAQGTMLGTGSQYTSVASLSTWWNKNPTICTLHLEGGTVTLVEKRSRDQTTAWTIATGTPCQVRCLPGEGVRVTWAVDPTWSFHVEP